MFFQCSKSEKEHKSYENLLKMKMKTQLEFDLTLVRTKLPTNFQLMPKHVGERYGRCVFQILFVQKGGKTPTKIEGN